MQFARVSPGPQSPDMSIPRKKGPLTALHIDTPVQITHIAVTTGETSASTSTLSSAVSEPDGYLPFSVSTKPRSLRNMKKLSLTLPSAQSSTSSLASTLPLDPLNSTNITRESQRLDKRRLSIMSLPAVSTTATLLHRKEEEGSPTVPYVDGPIQVVPGIWLGSEDNARDWKGLLERGIKSILNVAKEVVSPFDSAATQPQRRFASTPNLLEVSKAKSTFYPAHIASGRPGMHYLKLQWSHGQSDLVQEGFPAAMSFVDGALHRGEGVLIHCQCGISRSATLVIALVMRAAALSSPSVPPEVWALKGYQAAYSFVKEKSKWIGPNMSLIYQLLEYERTLRGGDVSPAMSDRSSILAEEEEEWGRRRRMLDDAPPSPAEDEDRESMAFLLEAQALDKAMEDRVVARKSSASSLSSVGVGMGPTWRARYSGRNRAPSIASNRTSIISEDLVEEEEEEELLGVGGGFDDASVRPRNSSTDGEDSSTSSTSIPKEDANSQDATPRLRLPCKPLTARLQPPSTPASGSAFSLPPVPTTASRASFDLPPRPNPKTKTKRRPPPLGLLPPVPSSPINVIPKTVAALPPRIRKESRKPTPPPLHLRASENSIVTSKKPQSLKHTQTPSQTLFVFPPSPTTTRTPSTMTLTSNFSNVIPFPKAATPRVATFRSQGRTRSFIGLGVPPTPTTACSRVDARGWFGAEKEK